MMNSYTTYEAAASNCLANNMKLFRVDSSDVQNALWGYTDFQLHHIVENIWTDQTSLITDAFTTSCNETSWSVCEFPSEVYSPPKGENFLSFKIC